MTGKMNWMIFRDEMADFTEQRKNMYIIIEGCAKNDEEYSAASEVETCVEDDLFEYYWTYLEGMGESREKLWGACYDMSFWHHMFRSECEALESFVPATVLRSFEQMIWRQLEGAKLRYRSQNVEECSLDEWDDFIEIAKRKTAPLSERVGRALANMTLMEPIRVAFGEMYQAAPTVYRKTRVGRVWTLQKLSYDTFFLDTYEHMMGKQEDSRFSFHVHIECEIEKEIFRWDDFAGIERVMAMYEMMEKSKKEFRRIFLDSPENEDMNRAYCACYR